MKKLIIFGNRVSFSYFIKRIQRLCNCNTKKCIKILSDVNHNNFRINSFFFPIKNINGIYLFENIIYNKKMGDSRIFLRSLINYKLLYIRRT